MRTKSDSKKGPRETPDLFAIAFNANPHPAAITTFPEGRFLKVNDALLQISGYSRAELIGQRATDRFWHAADERQEIARILRDCGAVRNQEITVRTKAGTVLLVSFCAVVIEFDGQPCLLATASDITERKRGEEQLREAQGRFEELMHHIEGIVWEADAQTFRFNFVSSQAERLLGYPLARWLAEPDFWANHIHPDDRDWAVQFCLTATHQQRDHDFEYRMIAADGRVVWLRDLVTVVSEGGQAVKLRGVMIDVTQQRLAEAELRASEEKYRELVENIHDVIYTCDNQGHITYLSPAIERTLGIPPAEFLGRSFQDFIHADDLPLVETSFQRVMAGDLHPTEYRIIGKDGTARWVHSISRPIIVNGQAVGLSGIIADVTKRRKAEEALRDSEQRYRTMVNAAQEGIWVLDSQARGSYLNQRMAQMLGYSVEEMSSRSIYDFLDPAHHSEAEACFVNLHKGAKAQHDYRFRHKDGSTIWTICSTNPLFNDAGGFIGAMAMITDITDRKRAEQQRDELLAREKAARVEAEHIGQLYARLFDREQGARTEAEAVRREWQTTFDTMADCVLLVDRNDQLVRANRAFYEWLNLAPEQTIDRPVTELLHQAEADSPAVQSCAVCNLRRKGERAIIELPAGSITTYPVVISIDPITDEAGATTGVVQVMRDLTELYRARGEAERERASLNAAIEQLAEGLMVFDEHEVVIRANRQARAMLELPETLQIEGDITREPVGEFSNEQGQVMTLDDLPVQRALREQRPIETRLWYTRLDSQRLFLSVAASPLFNDQNQLIGAIALVRDVTEQQREYERSQQADKLRALGQLASGVAHNFNNALAAVLGYTQLSLPKVQGTEVEKYLHVVEKSAKDAARMVERIQNFARARARTDDFLPIRISDIVRDAIDITRPRWRHDAEALGVKYDVQLDWQVDEDSIISGESSELREVFVNIIFNALDAMPKGGQLAIRATADDGHVVIRFADTGSGMSEEIKQRIFEPFFTTKGVLGLGMGLSETYRIIERHGGRIDVHSQLRQGTTFTIRLPMAQRKKNEAAGLLASSARRGAEVLVIDDEEYVRNVLAAILAEMGHRVTVAGSADEALQLVETRNFAIVFTDLAMPKKDGIAAASEIKARHPQTKIVLMSGYGADRATERAAASNCIDAALNKPFRVAEIQNALLALLPS